MTAYDECDHGGDPYACPVCARERAADHGGAVTHWPTPGPRALTFVGARFSSNCPTCLGLILPGDEIARVDDEFVCRPCAEEAVR